MDCLLSCCEGGGSGGSQYGSLLTPDQPGSGGGGSIGGSGGGYLHVNVGQVGIHDIFWQLIQKPCIEQSMCGGFEKLEKVLTFCFEDLNIQATFPSK